MMLEKRRCHFFVNNNLNFLRQSMTGALMLIEEGSGSSRLALFGKMSTDLCMFSALLLRYGSSSFPVFWSVDFNNANRERWEELFEKKFYIANETNGWSGRWNEKVPSRYISSGVLRRQEL